MKIQCRATLSLWNTGDSAGRYWMYWGPRLCCQLTCMSAERKCAFPCDVMCAGLMYTEKWWRRVCMLHYSVRTAEVQQSDRVFPLEKGAAVEGRVFYWMCEHCFFRRLKQAWSGRGNLSLVPRLSGAPTSLTPLKKSLLYAVLHQTGSSTESYFDTRFFFGFFCWFELETSLTEKLRGWKMPGGHIKIDIRILLLWNYWFAFS